MIAKKERISGHSGSSSGENTITNPQIAATMPTPMGKACGPSGSEKNGFWMFRAAIT